MKVGAVNLPQPLVQAQVQTQGQPQLLGSGVDMERASADTDAKNSAEASAKDLSEDEIIKAVENANKALVQRTTQLKFSIHEKTKEIMVKVIDRETKEVIREIPPEKILDMVAKLWEMAGILVDERR